MKASSLGLCVFIVSVQCSIAQQTNVNPLGGTYSKRHAACVEKESEE